MTDQDLAGAVAELRLVVVQGLTEIRGQLALVIQRLDHVDARHAELVRRVDDDRSATNARLEELHKANERFVTKEEHAEARRRLIAVVGVMLTAAAVVIALLSLIRA
ncbi:hypothetical protein Aple_010830 [Acrocarpospora pleiomorpha]|uniref:Uncharacterized protein n=1 Tax=Acrocarpospora pleiomorpha TaxID=90975 RepID=A0A5M3XJE3_9ACTN|nr:hypothetical protein [Acrocarpospora pleiomorpha]GES18188.1 hypothetical protein Aple_010830 [Acrocarpospora pleiomorpha]